jgi:trimethylamine monooxygenase
MEMAAQVAVIGAGPCGLAQLHAFEQARRGGAEVPRVVCFEQQGDWGGLWNYTWRTGLDEHGDPVHGSMYRYLWSNGPKECLEFADYTFDEHFGRPVGSFPPRAVLFDYITGRARAGGVRRLIRFGTAVRWVRYDQDAGKFAVTVQARADGRTRTGLFDKVIVATGHFSTPNMPAFAGFGQFPGRIMHSHDFRDAREFAGQRLLVIGSSYSAEDIALQAAKYGARSVTVSWRTRPMGFPWPGGIEEVPLLSGLDGGTARFADGTAREVDAIVLCTGYQHAFRFLPDELRLRTANVLYPAGLYKGIFWLANPGLMYLGMQDQYYTFTMFDTQAWYARDYVLGRITLPPQQQMAADIAAWRGRLAQCAGPADEIDFQAAYLADLHKQVDYPRYDLDLTRAHFKTWEHDKMTSITGYRDRSFTSPCTGTTAPARPTPWWTELDDTMTTFLDTPT